MWEVNLKHTSTEQSHSQDCKNEEWWLAEGGGEQDGSSEECKAQPTTTGVSQHQSADKSRAQEEPLNNLITSADRAELLRQQREGLDNKH